MFISYSFLRWESDLSLTGRVVFLSRCSRKVSVSLPLAQLLEAVHMPWFMVPPSIFRASNTEPLLPCFHYITVLSTLSSAFSTCKNSYNHIGPIWKIQDNIPIFKIILLATLVPFPA